LLTIRVNAISSSPIALHAWLSMPTRLRSVELVCRNSLFGLHEHNTDTGSCFTLDLWPVVDADVDVSGTEEAGIVLEFYAGQLSVVLALYSSTRRSASQLANCLQVTAPPHSPRTVTATAGCRALRPPVVERDGHRRVKNPKSISLKKYKSIKHKA